MYIYIYIYIYIYATLITSCMQLLLLKSNLSEETKCKRKRHNDTKKTTKRSD